MQRSSGHPSPRVLVRQHISDDTRCLEVGSTKWKHFNLVLSSYFDLDAANEHLRDVIPYYDELAILVIDPKTMAG